MLTSNCRVLILQVLYMLDSYPPMHTGVILFKTYTTELRFPSGHESIFGAKPCCFHQDCPNSEVVW